MGGVGQCMVTLILKCKMTVKNYDLNNFYLTFFKDKV